MQPVVEHMAVVVEEKGVIFHCRRLDFASAGFLASGNVDKATYVAFPGRKVLPEIDLLVESSNHGFKAAHDVLHNLGEDVRVLATERVRNFIPVPHG